MQVSDSPQHQRLNFASKQLQNKLQDIVSKVQIHSNLSVSHPDYKPWQLPESAVNHFQRLPWQLQLKYLSLQLRSFLYGIYYNGSLKVTLAHNANSTSFELYQNLENNTILGVDQTLYQQLHQSNSGIGYFSQNWRIAWQEIDGSLVVTKDGLSLHIEREIHLQPSQKNATVCDKVNIRMPRNLVQNGFYVAVSNAGLPDENIVRVYFNLSPEGAVAIMEALTQQLNAFSLPFSLKALYNPFDYGRYNSAILYFQKSDYESVQSVLDKVYLENQCHFQKQIPLFTKLIAPGLAIAEEPDHKFTDRESFGMNRCQIVANALLEAWQQNNESPEGRMTTIWQHFSMLGIELQRPYLKANSEDIYKKIVNFDRLAD